MIEDGTARLLRMVVVPDFLVHLDGTSEPLHGLVAEGVVATDDAQAAKDWMKLFCGNVASQEAIFSIVETDDEMLWTAGASVDERSQVVAHLGPFLVEKDSSGRHQGKACMLYGRSLLRVTLDLLGTQVRMLDEEVLLENLSVRRRRYQDGWVVIDAPGSQFESQE